MSKFMEKLFFDCGQIREFLYNYMEGKLSFMTRLRFNAHLIMCKPCREYFELYKTAANPKQFIESTPMSDELVHKTLSFLENEGILNKDDPKAV